jgi:hypothetical protein
LPNELKEEFEMAQFSSNRTVDEAFTKVVTPTFSAVSMDEIASDTLSGALSFCAQKLNLGHSAQAALERMKDGDGAAHKYWQYGVAKRVAGYLAGWDENIRAVYACDYDATPEDLVFGNQTRVSLAHMIVWTERKTAALDSLIAALDGALVKQFADLMGLDRLAHLLDVQVVDDGDVEARKGYAALLTSLHNSPIQVWKQ